MTVFFSFVFVRSFFLFFCSHSTVHTNTQFNFVQQIKFLVELQPRKRWNDLTKIKLNFVNSLVLFSRIYNFFLSRTDDSIYSCLHGCLIDSFFLLFNHDTQSAIIFLCCCCCCLPAAVISLLQHIHRRNARTHKYALIHSHVPQHERNINHRSHIRW